MKRIMLEITPELAQAIDGAADGSRNAAIESWLWRVGPVRESARRQGIDKPARRTRGRPRAG